MAVNDWVSIAGREYIEVTIDGGETESEVIALGDRVPIAVETDSDFAGSAITFECGIAEGSLKQYNAQNAELSLTIGASQVSNLAPFDTYGMTGYLKLVSGTAQGGSTPTTVIVIAESK